MFLLGGELIEHGPMSQIFTSPKDERTERYVSGKLGLRG
jgi:phosphate transport system ATP-binding protein